MARVRAGDYSQKRDLILKRAADLFAGDGFDRVSMVKIAEHCRISKSTLYHYFETKNEILHALLRDHLEASVAAVDAVLHQGTESRTQVRAVVRALVQQNRGGEAQQRCLALALSALTPGARAEIDDLQISLIERVEEILVRHGPGLRRRHGGPRPVTLVLLAMIGGSMTLPENDERLSPIELARLAADLFLDGVDAVASPA